MTQKYIKIILASTLALTQTVAAMPGKMPSDEAAAEGLTPPASPSHQATPFMTPAHDQTAEADDHELDPSLLPPPGAAESVPSSGFTIPGFPFDTSGEEPPSLQTSLPGATPSLATLLTALAFNHPAAQQTSEQSGQTSDGDDDDNQASSLSLEAAEQGEPHQPNTPHDSSPTAPQTGLPSQDDKTNFFSSLTFPFPYPPQAPGQSGQPSDAADEEDTHSEHSVVVHEDGVNPEIPAPYHAVDATDEGRPSRKRLFPEPEEDNKDVVEIPSGHGQPASQDTLNPSAPFVPTAATASHEQHAPDIMEDGFVIVGSSQPSQNLVRQEDVSKKPSQEPTNDGGADDQGGKEPNDPASGDEGDETDPSNPTGHKSDNDLGGEEDDQDDVFTRDDNAAAEVPLRQQMLTLLRQESLVRAAFVLFIAIFLLNMGGASEGARK